MWEVCVISSLAAVFLPPFHLGYFGVSVLFRAAGERLSQDGLTYDLFPILNKERCLEPSPPRVLKQVTQWLKSSRRTQC